MQKTYKLCNEIIEDNRLSYNSVKNIKLTNKRNKFSTLSDLPNHQEECLHDKNVLSNFTNLSNG